ncbi:transposase family protein [Streptomyces sanglieri]|uniref:Transposase family protein n=1 Tax=Streptomyces sanglieri TaxID=193460 RepID=A0ABW2WMV7_9ACTN
MRQRTPRSPASSPGWPWARTASTKRVYGRAKQGAEYGRFNGIRNLPTLADKGYIGIGIRVPVRRPKGKSEQALGADTRTTNCLVRDLRTLGERTAAELKERWRTLKRVTLSPSRIGDTARAALALNRHWK